MDKKSLSNGSLPTRPRQPWWHRADAIDPIELSPDEPLLARTRSLVFLIDQFTKYAAVAFGTSVQINPSLAFGLPPFSSRIVFALIVIFLLVLIWRLAPGDWKVAAIIGAGVSNLFDRFRFGGVRDWLPVPFFGITNNLADWVIVICLVLLVVQLRHGRPRRNFTN